MPFLDPDQILAPKFRGVFSRDNLPDLAEEYIFNVCTTDPLKKMGDHWVVLHATWVGEYFDSLGGEYRYVSLQTQELFSSVCGQYCIVYMSLRARGHSMDDIGYVLEFQGEDSDRFVTCLILVLVKYQVLF